MRKLASVRQISKIVPAVGLDNLELAKVDGWQVLVKKGEYKEGDKVVYLEPDSWVPHHLAPYLSKGAPKVYQGVEGEKLKTIKLKGHLSQGLILPLSVLFPEGKDVTAQLGILKWEVPSPIGGEIKGLFPYEVPKTDQERIQNLASRLDTFRGEMFEVTEKLEGTSATFYLDVGGEFHVCSRNLELKAGEGVYGAIEKVLSINERMVDKNLYGYAIQGEIVGPKIQKNYYKLPHQSFYVFDIFNVEEQKYVGYQERHKIVDMLGLNHVPVVAITTLGEDSVDDLLFRAKGESQLAEKIREGLVYKSENVTFKVINNDYLLKENNNDQ